MSARNLATSAWPVTTNLTHRLAIPFYILEILVSTNKIINSEVVFIIKQTSTSTDNLLELDHIVNGTEQDNISDISCIYSSGQLARCSKNSRPQPIIILENPQLIFTLVTIICSYTHTIITIWPAFMLIDEIPDDCSVSLNRTEYKGLLIWVNLLQQLNYTVLISLSDLNLTIVEILLSIDLVNIDIALNIIILVILILVDVTLGNPDPEWSKISISDTLLQRISIYSIAEIIVCISIYLTTRSCSHTKLISRLEPIHQPTPLALIICTTSMTLINDDEIKEVRLILHEIWLVAPFRTTHKRLENREINMSARRNHVMRLMQRLRSNSYHRILREIIKVVSCLIRKNVSISNKENTWFSILNLFLIPSGLKQLPTNLESSVSLTSTSRHRQQNTTLLLCDRIKNIVNGILLIISW